MPRSRPFCVILTTYSKPSVGRRIARTLIESRLAGCVQEIPIRSTYRWEGRVVREAETLMLIKARRSDFGRIEKAITACHDYAVPEILQLEIGQASKAYIGWLSASTRRDGSSRRS